LIKRIGGYSSDQIRVLALKWIRIPIAQNQVEIIDSSDQIEPKTKSLPSVSIRPKKAPPDFQV
jgi:hypothetical protein